MGMRGALAPVVLIVTAFVLGGCSPAKPGSPVIGGPTTFGAEAPTTALGQQLEIRDGGATVDVTVADLRSVAGGKEVTVTLRGVSGIYHATPNAFTGWTADGDQLDVDSSSEIAGSLQAADVSPGQTLSGTTTFKVRPGGVVQRIVMQEPLHGTLGTWTVPGVAPSPTTPSATTLGAGPLTSPTLPVPMAHGTLGQACTPPRDNHAVAADGSPLKCTSTNPTSGPHWVRSVPVLGTAPAGSPCDPGVQGVMLSPEGQDMLCNAAPAPSPAPTGVIGTPQQHGTWQTVH